VYAMNQNLKASVEKKFAILRSRTSGPRLRRMGNRQSRCGSPRSSTAERTPQSANWCAAGRGRVPPLADLFPARFKLWLDQDHSLQRAPAASLHVHDHRGQHQRAR